MSSARPVPGPAPWWLEGGEETCEVCFGTYAYEVEVRCVDCDQPMCPTCAVRVRVRAEVYCPECAPAEARSDDRPGRGEPRRSGGGEAGRQGEGRQGESRES